LWGIPSDDVRCASREAHKDVFESCGAGGSFECSQSIASEQAPIVDNRDSVSEKFYLRQSVRGEEQGSIAAAQNLGLQEAAKLGSGDGVKTARWLIEKQDAGLVKQSAGKAEALNRAGREGAYLTIESFRKMELFGEKRDALRGGRAGEMVEAAEEAKIVAARQARIESEVAPCMITELAANCARIEDSIVSGDLRAALRGEKKRGENAKQGGFAGAICAKQCQRFARAQFERDTAEGHHGRFFKRLEKRPPPTARGRKRFLKIFNAYCGFGHNKTYNVSAARRQSACKQGQPGPNRRLLSRHGECRESPVEWTPAKRRRMN
jgi:hypothetical protein